MRSASRVLVLAGAILLIAATAAAQDARQITVGGQDTLTASASNPLSVPDVLVVDFNGPAVSDGLVAVDLPDDVSEVSCSDETHTCRMMLDAGEERELQFGMEGAQPGDSEFMVTVSSETTGKRSQATMDVRVRPAEGSGSVLTFLKRLLGIG